MEDVTYNLSAERWKAVVKLTAYVGGTVGIQS